jgi:hypothetical protein
MHIYCNSDLNIGQGRQYKKRIKGRLISGTHSYKWELSYFPTEILADFILILIQKDRTTDTEAQVDNIKIKQNVMSFVKLSQTCLKLYHIKHNAA